MAARWAEPDVDQEGDFHGLGTTGGGLAGGRERRPYLAFGGSSLLVLPPPSSWLRKPFLARSRQRLGLPTF